MQTFFVIRVSKYRSNNDFYMIISIVILLLPSCNLDCQDIFYFISNFKNFQVLCVKRTGNKLTNYF